MTEKKKYPVPVLMNDGTELPKSGTYYIVAENGLYIRKENSVLTATIKLSGISFLEKAERQATWNAPKIPFEAFVQTLQFFRHVYAVHKSEANVILYFDEKTKKFSVDATEQKVSGASADYAVESKAHEGLSMIGTIHSHCNFSAFHSGTDIRDEQYFDGIHFTIGFVPNKHFGLVGSLVVNENRFTLKPHNFIDGVIEANSTSDTGYGNSRFSRVCAGVRDIYTGGWNSGGKKYCLSLPQGKVIADYSFPEKWKAKINKYSAVKTTPAIGYDGGSNYTPHTSLPPSKKNQEGKKIRKLTDIEKLGEILGNGNLAERKSAIRRLYGLALKRDRDKTKDGELIIFFESASTADGDYEIREYGIKGLGFLGDSKYVLETLKEVAKNDDEPSNRNEAKKAAEKVEGNIKNKLN